jgi:hypothetical protein
LYRQETNKEPFGRNESKKEKKLPSGQIIEGRTKEENESVCAQAQKMNMQTALFFRFALHPLRTN